MTKDSSDEKSYLDDGARVALYHQQLLDDISCREAEQAQELSAAVDSSEALLLSLGFTLPERPKPQCRQPVTLPSVIVAKSWATILAEAKEATPEQVDYRALLTPSEIDIVLKKHAAIGSELSWFDSLNRYDFVLSVATGVIAGIIDILLVGIPAHPGFLGNPRAEGGWLSNIMKEKVNNLFPESTIKDLEKAYRVSFDPSTNAKLHTKVPGLGPGTHRFQSPGHDPFLGFIFGVRDILTGEFSAISKDGHLIVQHVADPLLQGEEFVIRILEALKTQFGHLASDIATPLGLPAPLMPLLLFLQFGTIGNKQYTIGEVARQMYRSGYDFRHFMAGSIPVMVTEIIIRLGNVIESISLEKTRTEVRPLDSSLKLRRQLLLAHSVATLINAGKVSVTQNPLALSWVQALAFIYYVMPELALLLYGKEAIRSQLVEEEILRDYHGINSEIDAFLKRQDDFSLVI